MQQKRAEAAEIIYTEAPPAEVAADKIHVVTFESVTTSMLFNRLQLGEGVVM